MPSPQVGSLQSSVQLSSFSGSQASTPACTRPSPQVGRLHSRVHEPESEFAPPSSHSSPAWTMPSPQLGSRQVLLPASSSSVLPSSHASPGWLMPSPQRAALHSDVQASLSTALPSSHSSAGVAFSATMPSPQVAFVHRLVQPSWLLRFPSSHSSPSSNLPLPHNSETPPGGGTSSLSPQAMRSIANSGRVSQRATALGSRLITGSPRVQTKRR